MEQHPRRKSDLTECGVSPRRGLWLTCVLRKYGIGQVSANGSAYSERKNRQVTGLVEEIARPSVSSAIENQLTPFDGHTREK